MKEHLKAAGVESGVNKISADNASLDDVRRQCKAVLDALNRTDFHVDIGTLKSIKMKVSDKTTPSHRPLLALWLLLHDAHLFSVLLFMPCSCLVPLSLSKDMEIKSAKALFGDTDKKIENVKELPESIRNLLLAGALIMKHSNTAAPRQRHVYITPDLKSVTRDAHHCTSAGFVWHAHFLFRGWRL